MAVIIVNLATSIIILVGIFLSTQKSPKNTKKFIRAIVIISVGVSFCANVYLSYQDGQYKHLLIDKLNSMQDRMKIVDAKLIEKSEESKEILSSPSTDDLHLKKKGNIAGYVKTADGSILALVTITRLLNNIQTMSHERGDFIVVSVSEEEILRFHKEGYKDFNYKVKSSDFNKLFEIIIKED